MFDVQEFDTAQVFVAVVEQLFDCPVQALP
jgi:hypothetical protein